MKILVFSRHALCSCVAAVMLAGCDGSQPSIGTPGAVPQAPAIALRADRGKSWMLPESQGKTTLLYVSLGLHRVGVFDYDTGKRVGTLTGFDDSYGGCVDAKGDVYITEYFNGDTVEYAHGGTKPLKTFVSNGQAWGCSVGAGNDLAVNDRDTRTGAGQVCVWKGGKSGSQSICYTGLAACGMMSPAGYDDRGNLFVPGEDNTTGDVCVLLSGATSMTKLPLNYSFNTPGAAMWDGKYVTLSNGAQTARKRASSALRFPGRRCTMEGGRCWAIPVTASGRSSWGRSPSARKIRQPTANKARSSSPTTAFAQSKAQSYGNTPPAATHIKRSPKDLWWRSASVDEPRATARVEISNIF
ncbi:MAG: hypothetical protein WAL67_04700 [Candidatus Cybelea sp.]